MVSFEETIFRTPTNNAMMLSVSGVLANDFVQCGVVGDQNLDVCINVTNKLTEASFAGHRTLNDRPLNKDSLKLQPL